VNLLAVVVVVVTDTAFKGSILVLVYYSTTLLFLK